MATVDNNQLAIQFETRAVGQSCYLFNTHAVPADPKIFVLPSDVRRPTGAAGRGTVHFATLHNREVVIKHYHRGGRMRHLSADMYLFSGYESSRVWRELKLLAHMHEQGLPSPLPIAGVVSRVAGLWYRAQLITEHIPAEATVGDWLATRPFVESQWRAMAHTINRFHSAGVCHADLNAHNILIDQQGDFHLIDFDKGVLAYGAPAVGLQRNSLGRLHRSLIKLQTGNPAFSFTPDNWDQFMAAIELD